MAAQTNVQVIIEARDNASHVVKGVGSSVSSASKQMEADFKGAGIMATAFLGSLTALAAGAVKVASSFEQNRIAFETMLGSAEAAKGMMTSLAKFTLETPFEMPQVVQGAKSLMAYGIAAGDIIPTFKMLGDIASGVGMDKLPNLVLAFGQVKAATRLTGMELRQFTETGVPMIEILGKQMNKTSAEIKDMISAGEVNFDDVKTALASLTGEGGKFQDLMIKQSKSFAGLMSNIKDKITQTMSEIAGVSVATGEIREGSLFAVLKTAAEKLYVAIGVLTPKLVAFSNWLLSNKTALMAIAGVIGGLLVAAVVGFVMVFGPAIALAAQFAVVGGLIAVAIGGVIKAFGGFEGIAEKVGGVLANVRDTFERLKGVIPGYLEEFKGQLRAFAERLYDTFKLDPSKISFGDFFTQMAAKIKPQIDNIGAQIKQGFTNALNINFAKEGEGGGNIGDLFGRLMGVITPLSELVLRVLTPAFDAFRKGLEAAKPQLDILLQQLGPLLINALQILAGVLAFVLGVFLMLMSGIITAVSYAIPFVIKIITGLAEFLNGIMMIIVGIFTLNWNMIWEGVKTVAKGILDTITGVFGAVLKFIEGFIKGIIQFFRQLFDTLVGKSIIPELVNAVVAFFEDMVKKVLNWAKDLYEGIKEKFDWIKDKVEGVINFIRNLIDNFKPKINIGIDLPDIEGAWKGLKERARKIGIPGFQTGGIVPGPIGAPALAMVHGGERVTPSGLGGGGNVGGGVTFNVSIGLYAGTETEKRNIARDLYGALLQVAQSQSKTVQEMMGG